RRPSVRSVPIGCRAPAFRAGACAPSGEPGRRSGAVPGGPDEVRKYQNDQPDIMKAEAFRIADGVYWVGTLDWDLRSYHGYTLPGTTYNAYRVFGRDRVALIDNTCPGTSAQMWARIAHAFA